MAQSDGTGWYRQRLELPPAEMVDDFEPGQSCFVISDPHRFMTSSIEFTSMPLILRRSETMASNVKQIQEEMELIE